MATLKTTNASRLPTARRCVPMALRAASGPRNAGQKTQTVAATPSTPSTAMRMTPSPDAGNTANLALFEVERQPAGRRQLLSAVRVAPSQPTRPIGRGGHLHKRELPDPHARIQRNRQVGPIADLESVQADVYARGLNQRGFERIDFESAAGDGFADRAVRRNHRAVRRATIPTSLLLPRLARSIRRRTSSSKDEMSANARYTDAKRMYATWSSWRSFSIARSPITELSTSAVSRPRRSASICSTVRSIVSALIGRLVHATCRLRRSLSGFHSWRR